MKKWLLFIFFLISLSPGFGQNIVEFKNLSQEGGQSILMDSNLVISGSSMISLHKFDKSQPDSSRFKKFAFDKDDGTRYFHGIGNDYIHGFLILDNELDISIYCGDYTVIAKDSQNDSILFEKSKLCGMPTFVFENCGFKPDKYDFKEKKLYYIQTGIFNNSRRKVLKLKELKNNQED